VFLNCLRVKFVSLQEQCDRFVIDGLLTMPYRLRNCLSGACLIPAGEVGRRQRDECAAPVGCDSEILSILGDRFRPDSLSCINPRQGLVWAVGWFNLFRVLKLHLRRLQLPCRKQPIALRLKCQGCVASSRRKADCYA